MHTILAATLTLVAAQTPAPQTAAPARPFAYALALEAAQAALASCQPGGPAVVEVMDTALNPTVLLVADGSRPNLIDFARRKAYTVIKKGVSSAEFGASVGPQGRGAPPIEGDANLITFGGGLPIKIGDDVVAAISVSGPNGPAADEACARAGLERIAPRLVRAGAPPDSKTRVVLLGTGSPNPTPDRSGPATAIVVGDRAYLIDAGPGVVRRASAAAKSIPALNPTKITVAFVTHLHSDHTVGYPDLLLSPWVIGRTAPLNVYGPQGLEEMTRDVLHAWRRDIAIRTTGLEHRSPIAVRAHDIKPGVVYKDDRVTVTAFRVPHGQWSDAFGYRFDTPDRSIVISGDTSPSDEVVAQCHGCDVLIHEAYSPNGAKPAMENWDAYSAKYHTSTVQLAEIATRAQPKLLILYHQSERSPDAQMLAEVRKGYAGKVVSGHDLDVY